MRYRDCIRLGRIGIRSRKKSTRNTVLGIAFGLIMLVPVLFFALAFSLDLKGAVNRNRNVSSFYVTTVHELEQRDGYNGETEGVGAVMLGRTEREALADMVGEEIEEIVRQEYVFIASDENKFSLDGESLIFHPEPGSSGTQHQVNQTIKIIGDGRGCGNIVPAAFAADLEREGKSLFAAGGGFSETEKGEILISEEFAARYGKAPAEFVGKKLTLTTRVNGGHNSTHLDNDNDPDNAFPENPEIRWLNAEYFRDFEVVGVVSADYYRLNDRTAGDAHLWISGKSYYEEDEPYQGKFLPEIRVTLTEDHDGRIRADRVVTYREGFDAANEQAIREGMFFPAMPGGTFYSPYVNIINEDGMYHNAAVCFVQCRDYRSAETVSEALDSGYARLGTEPLLAISEYSTAAYLNLLMLDRVGGYLVIVLCTFGGIIFLATLLNLYNSVNYSVQVRKHYLGMMRAIGARQALLPRLYFVEILLIFGRSLPWVLVFGGGLSYGIKAFVDYAFAESVPVFGVAVRLNFGYFFAALGIAAVFLFAVAFAFSRIASLNVTKKPILEVLSDER